MNIARPVNSKVTGVSFAFYTPEEVRAMSVKKIVNPILIDNLGNPTKGGLYDSALGPFSKRHLCATCSLDYFSCPGHFGHIELPSPVVNTMMFEELFTLMQSMCFYCHCFRISKAEQALFIARFTLLENGLLSEAMDIESLSPRRASPRSQSLEEKGDDTAMDLEGESGGADRDETPAEYIDRLRHYIDEKIAECKPDSTKYKITVVNQVRTELIQDFFRRCKRERCSNCNAINNKLRRDGSLKIFKLPLIKRQKLIMQTMNLTPPDVLHLDFEELEKIKKFGQDQTEEDNRLSAHMDVNGDADEEQDDEGDDDTQSTYDAVDALPKKAKTRGDETAEFLTPLHLRNHTRLLFTNEPELVQLLFGQKDPDLVTTFELLSGKSSQASTLKARFARGCRKPRQIAEMFFIEVLPIPPTRFRPPSVLNGEVMENAQNVYLGKILATCVHLRDLVHGTDSEPGAEGDEAVAKAASPRGSPLFEKIINTWIRLQQDVNNLIDSSKNPQLGSRGDPPPPGIRQLLEKKEGLFRMNMMGKRVNYAARSVISPDPNVDTCEVGVPPVFAQTLTYPEPVTPYNVKELRRAVINGPKQWPGAAYVQHEDGSLTSLVRLSYESRVALANQLLTPQDAGSNNSSGGGGGNKSGGRLGNIFTDKTNMVNKKVYRHLRNGDMVLLNRQPTLHKPSIMAHRVKVLPGERTIRMHYANCNTYNADFDGDEMNMHFPQSETARAEASLIAATDYQYLKPTNGDPLRGLIMDSIDAGVLLTKRDTFFTREEYMQLLYGAIRPEQEPQLPQGKIITLPPAIFRPRPMWTGKQVVSTVLVNLTKGYHPANFRSKCKIPEGYWGNGSKEESKLLVMDGELLMGVLDKGQIGASAHGLVHAIYELYSPQHAGRLLTILSRLLIKFFQLAGFSCRMDDLLLTPEGDALRRKVFRDNADLGKQVAYEFVGLAEHAKRSGYNNPDLQREFTKRMEEVFRHDNKLAALDVKMSGAGSTCISTPISSKTLPKHLYIDFPKNRLLVMTSSGAKGSNVNFSFISCCLGQQALEGRRVPVMASGKTLPSFLPFDVSVRAGGFIADRFLTGLHPQEFYFHCMAGREGLIDTAVKTANSGYLQRCLIKHLEGLKVHYDYSVRDSDGSVLQFHYGGDALDVTKQKYLWDFSFAAANYRALCDKFNPPSAAHALDEDSALSYAKKVAKKPHKYDPVLSKYSPAVYLGSVSSKFYTQLNEHIKNNPEKLIQVKPKKGDADAKQQQHQRQAQQESQRRDGGEGSARDATYERFLGHLARMAQVPPLKTSSNCTPRNYRVLQYLNYMKSLVDPGEVVGVLAAQSIGEPSTQMTLNTFHLAGHGAGNVTLGIPRLREIVMTASMSPKTPNMSMALLDHISEEQTAVIAQKLSRLTLSELTNYIEVQERLIKENPGSPDGRRCKQYRVRINLFPLSEIKAEHGVDRNEMEDAICNNFILSMERAIAKELRRSYKKLNEIAGNEEEFEMPTIGVPLKKPGDSKATSNETGAAEEDDSALPAKRSKMSSVDNDDADDIVDGDDDNDGGEGLADGDATDAKQAARRRQQSTYEEEEYNDDEPANTGGDENAMLEEMSNELKNLDEEATVASPKSGNAKGLPDAESNARRQRELRDRYLHVIGYEFHNDGKENVCRCDIVLRLPAKSAKILMVNLAEQACKKAVVRETPGIERCFVKPKGSENEVGTTLITDGCNLHSIWERAMLPLQTEKNGPLKYQYWMDINKLHSNSVGDILLTYGVEAARANIEREIKNVFGHYGISVDDRHIGLVADYMTFEGGYKPFNRTGIASNVSPFAKMSFETTCKFLTRATLAGDYDDLKNPSARIVLGQPHTAGTGSFDILMNVA